MTTALPSGLVREEDVLPDDLSLYLGKKTLVMLILEAIDDLNLRNPEGEMAESGRMNFQSAMMLTLLGYCYATGVYGSGDIQLATQYDRMIRYLCARDRPDLCAIRTFRRHHREGITRCLTAVLRRVWELRFRGEDAEPIGGISCRRSFSGWRTGMPVNPDFRREAEQRIARAVRADSMAADV